MTMVEGDELRLLIERIERLEEEKKGIADDVRDVYGEAKGRGYDAKIMRQIVRLRKMKPHDRQEMEMILDTYMAALGMTHGLTPLEKAVETLNAARDGRARKDIARKLSDAGITMTVVASTPPEHHCV